LSNEKPSEMGVPKCGVARKMILRTGGVSGGV